MPKQSSCFDSAIPPSIAEATILDKMDGTQTRESLADWKSLLDCPLCLSTMRCPIATACGHTFCSECLSKSLTVASQCPLCRAPCYLQPDFSLGRKPVVVLEKMIEMAFGEKINEMVSDLRPAGPFRVGLFFLNEGQFSMVPNRQFKFRAFEPYVLMLVRRCAEHGVRMGIQPKLDSAHGLIVRVDKLSPFPDRFHVFNHLLVQCHVEGLYRVVADPEEEPNSHGLYNVLVEEINSREGIDDPQLPELVGKARMLFERAVKQLEPAEAAAVFEDVYTGTMRVVPSDPVDLSFFLIESLNFPGNAEEAILYEPDIIRRLGFCINELSKDEVQFKRVASRRLLSRTREKLDLSRNVLLASGVMVFVGIVFGGFESLMSMPFMRRQ